MSLGERLNAYIDGRNRKQQEVALSWLEKWKQQGGRSWSESTVTSHLNRLLKDNPVGIRFFFEDRARAALLLGTLDTPEAEHAALFELADRALKDGGPQPRIIFDAASLGAGREQAAALFEELRQGLLAQGPFPIALVILEEQYDALPRSFDELKEKGQLRYVRAATPEEGWERILELADEQGLVLSARRFSDFERWLATNFTGKRLVFEPPNGLELFRTSGRLPGLPSVEHDLAALVPEAAERVTSIPAEPLALRLLMGELASEQGAARLKLAPESRQWLARQLGITAASTARERIEATITALARELPVKLMTSSAEEFQTLQIQATRRQTAPHALRVGDEVHLVNLGPEAAAYTEGRPWVHVHDIQPRSTALGRLLREVDAWTVGDFLADPFLEHVIARLDPESREFDAFLHARASLFYSGALKPRPVSLVEDWQSALEEMLSGRVPQASLCIRVNEYDRDYNRSETLGRRSGFIVTRPQVERAGEARHKALHMLTPLADVLVSRSDEVLFADLPSQEASRRSYDEERYYSYTKVDDLLLPMEAADARDTELWLDLFEGSFEKGTAPSHPSETVLRKVFSSRALSQQFYERSIPISLPPDLWQQCDLELAMTWAALQRALDSRQCILLPDGAVLLRLNGAFFAELRITPLGGSHPQASLRASLLLEPEMQRGTNHNIEPTADDFRHLVATHTATGGYEFGARLPRQLILLGKRFLAEVSFRGSALFAEASFPAAAAAAMAMAEDSRRTEEQRRQYDDDDDD